jgi:hypothetical protein
LCGCNTDEVCPSNWKCNQDNHHCEPNCNKSCSGTSDCPWNSSCNNCQGYCINPTMCFQGHLTGNISEKWTKIMEPFKGWNECQVQCLGYGGGDFVTFWGTPPPAIISYCYCGNFTGNNVQCGTAPIMHLGEKTAVLSDKAGPVMSSCHNLTSC